MELENILADHFDRIEGKQWSEGVQAVYAFVEDLAAKVRAETEAVVTKRERAELSKARCPICNERQWHDCMDSAPSLIDND